MARIKITVDGFKCDRCGHEWIPYKEGEPRVCPKCKSPYWNKPRREKADDAKVSAVDNSQ